MRVDPQMFFLDSTNAHSLVVEIMSSKDKLPKLTSQVRQIITDHVLDESGSSDNDEYEDDPPSPSFSQEISSASGRKRKRTDDVSSSDKPEEENSDVDEPLVKKKKSGASPVKGNASPGKVKPVPKLLTPVLPKVTFIYFSILSYLQLREL